MSYEKMKKIVFFDGDGTLWYPTETKRAKAPHWIYYNDSTKSNPLQHMSLTHKAKETLLRLKEHGVKCVLLSTHPHSPEEALKILKAKVQHFDLYKYFCEIHATPEQKQAKGDFILRILQQQRIPKKYALMVGDSYDWDYKPARLAGIAAVLIESAYRRLHPEGRRIRSTIRELDEVLDYV